MSKLILPRRRFLFTAPAIIAASNLMPGHSIAALLAPSVREFDVILKDPMGSTGGEGLWWGLERIPFKPGEGLGKYLAARIATPWTRLTDAEVAVHKQRLFRVR